MPNEHDALTDDQLTTGTAEPRPSAAEPDFIVRARRILSGDVRPDDYLPIPPEVQAKIDRELAATPGYAPYWKHMLNVWTLSFTHGGVPVAYRDTENGVLVFAVGLEQIRELLAQFRRDDQRDGFTLGPPHPWQHISAVSSQPH